MTTTTTVDPLTAAIGAHRCAEAHAGHMLEREAEIEARLEAAEAALIRTRATDAAGLIVKLELIQEGVSAERGTYGPLFDELQARIADAAASVPDFAPLEKRLTALARRLGREEAAEFYVRLARSAAADAKALAGA